MADKAAGKDGAPEKPATGHRVVRTLVVYAPDIVDEFQRVMAMNTPLTAQVMRELQQVHRIQPGTALQLAGIMVNVTEQLGEDEKPKQPSRIILPFSGRPH